MVEGVEVRVMDPGFVVQGILNELKRGQAQPAQENVIGGIRGLRDHRGGAQARERRQPFAEDRDYAEITLRIDTPNLAGSIVDIEIGREVRESREWLYRIGLHGNVSREVRKRRIGLQRTAGEMLFHVRARAEH